MMGSRKRRVFITGSRSFLIRSGFPIYPSLLLQTSQDTNTNTITTMRANTKTKTIHEEAGNLAHAARGMVNATAGAAGEAGTKSARNSMPSWTAGGKCMTASARRLWREREPRTGSCTSNPTSPSPSLPEWESSSAFFSHAADPRLSPWKRYWNSSDTSADRPDASPGD